MLFVNFLENYRVYLVNHNYFYNILRQVRRCAIITYKNSLYEFPHELPKDLKLRKLGNIRKVSTHNRMID